MSKLNLFGRPWVVFNPANKEHRLHYHNFVVTGSWGQCPFRFVVDEDHGDLVTMIQRTLIHFYTEKEFGNVVKKPQQKVRQNWKKTVDN